MLKKPHRSASSKERAAADAQRVRSTRQLAKQRQQMKDIGLQPRILPTWDGVVAPVLEDDDEDDVPTIHRALGKWPENSVPNIYWDLSNPGTWNYKRPFTEDELEVSPFDPEQKKMTILLCPIKGWIIDIKPRAGYEFMTLRCFQEAMTTAMQQPVPRHLWFSAGAWKKLEIVYTHYTRTGNLPIIPTADLFAEWKRYLAKYGDMPEVVDHIVNQMNQYVTRGAPRTMTQLRTIDLLGHNTMFAGLTYIKEMDLWVMSTTCRHLPGIAHRMSPGLATAPAPAHPAMTGQAQAHPMMRIPQLLAPMIQTVRSPALQQPMVVRMPPQMVRPTGQQIFQPVPRRSMPPMLLQTIQSMAPQEARSVTPQMTGPVIQQADQPTATQAVQHAAPGIGSNMARYVSGGGGTYRIQ